MPTYNFRDENGDEYEIFMRISELDAFKAENPNMVQYLTKPPLIVGGVGTNLKVDDGFREVISKVKEKYTVNNIKDY